MQEFFTDTKIHYETISLALCREIRSTFYDYAQSFRKEKDSNYNMHMELKEYHTKQVCLEINQLGKSFGMNSEECAFLEILALLHDIGRFEQFDKYGTFSDSDSINHSELAIEVIEERKILETLPEMKKNTLYQSILNHNIPCISEIESDSIDLYSRILRDADKLDIWRVALEYNIFHKIKSETFPTSYTVPIKLLEYFKNSQTIPLQEVKSYYDSILFRISWLFDLNFKHSIQQFSLREYGNKFLKKLPPSEELEEIRDFINISVEEALVK